SPPPRSGLQSSARSPLPPPLPQGGRAPASRVLHPPRGPRGTGSGTPDRHGPGAPCRAKPGGPDAAAAARTRGPGAEPDFAGGGAGGGRPGGFPGPVPAPGDHHLRAELAAGRVDRVAVAWQETGAHKGRPRGIRGRGWWSVAGNGRPQGAPAWYQGPWLVVCGRTRAPTRGARVVSGAVAGGLWQETGAHKGRPYITGVHPTRDHLLPPDIDAWRHAAHPHGRVIVIAPTRAACETIELGLGLSGIETLLERTHGVELRALAASGQGFGIVAGTGTGKTLGIRPIAESILQAPLRVGVVNREREATPETPSWNVVIVTTGIARRWFEDDLISRRDTLIVDEIHQTSAELELCLALGKRAGCRFIWLSATVDPAFYARYLDSTQV